MTVEEIKKKRLDLQRRLLIDINQFQIDTGMRVNSVELLHMNTLGQKTQELAYVEIEVILPS